MSEQNFNKQIQIAVISILAFVLAVFLFAQYRARQLSPEGHGIIIVDTATIIAQEVGKYANDPNVTTDSDKALKEAQQVSLKLKSVLDGYAKQGYIIINKKATLGFPPAMDKTDEVAKAIGLTK